LVEVQHQYLLLFQQLGKLHSVLCRGSPASAKTRRLEPFRKRLKEFAKVIRAAGGVVKKFSQPI
jgi:hypothetical protein